MRTLSAVLLGKIVSKLTRSLKLGGGSAAPGLYALKLDPEIVSKLSKRIPKNIIITGTNGKTTTSRMIAHFAKESGLKVIRNHTGSNLERGIASALIENYKLKTDNFDLGIWELDEAAFNSVAPKLNPDMVVFMNIFRDQLDRYGEVDSILKKWSETLKKLPKKTLVLVNGDDANTASLVNSSQWHTPPLAVRVYSFGLENNKIAGEGTKKSNNKLDYVAKSIKLNGLKGSSFELTINHKPLTIHSPLPGTYHIYDVVAAISSASLLGLSTKTYSLSTFLPAFGRVEKLPFGYIFLIKNPAGASQVFETIAPQIKKEDRLFLALNDNLADGTDVSWIWDANFESLRGSRSNLFVSGTRTSDLALRLKYAGFDPKQIKIVPGMENALREARKGLKGSLFILPTYTAMLELQKILTKLGIKEDYWNE